MGISLDKLPFKFLEEGKEKSSKLLLTSRNSLLCKCEILSYGNDRTAK